MGMYLTFEAQLKSTTVARLIERFPKLPLMHVDDEAYMCWYTHDDLNAFNKVLQDLLEQGMVCSGHKDPNGIFWADAFSDLISISALLNMAWEDQWHKNIRTWEAENKQDAQNHWAECMEYCDKQRLIFG